MGAEQAQGAEGAGFDGSNWPPQNLRGLVHAEFLAETQAEHLALLKAEVCQGVEQVGLAFLPLYPGLRVSVVHQRLRQVGLEINIPVVRALLVVEGQIASDTVEPG